ncbi:MULTISPECIES: spore coat protein [Bacillus]|uniref:Spore coat protein n=2 Tax=Bacillus TaxID=1386 RepID=A0A0M4FG06_9BACI|nr:MULTISPECIES: spore coat protein [Bacillus]ALC81374.1 hypothetical protein AM592_07025 [Bacillus gobiensis]MBP1080398.1 hypothetical protein [Bacillus capparidis]MED1094256.1 spore coat protein [Bacillus capparidis]
MFCRPRPNMMAPIVHPTKHCQNNTFSESVVPHIHPTHVNNVNHHKFNHVHYYPQTQSQSNQVSHQNFNAPGPYPGQVAGAQMGPGQMGPGQMGPDPGQVAGAQTGQFPNQMFPGQVGGAQEGPGSGKGYRKK